MKPDSTSMLGRLISRSECDSGSDSDHGTDPSTDGQKAADPTSPCPVCSSMVWWADVHGGGPHCRGCRPFKSSAFVRRLIDLSPSPPPDWIEYELGKFDVVEMVGAYSDWQREKLNEWIEEMK